MVYTITIGITVFGEPAGYSADALISEFKSFVEANSQLNLVITVNKYSVLADDEYYVDTTYNCRYPAPWLFHVDTKQKLPTNVQTNIILYNLGGVNVCYGGGMWGGDVGINGVPFIFVPLGAWPDVDNSPSCRVGICSWQRALSQELVHEWLHGIDWIFSELGYPSFPSSDTCRDYGFDGELNDPGWARCYQYFLSMITQPMYEAIQNWNKPLTCNPLQCQLQL